MGECLCKRKYFKQNIIIPGLTDSFSVREWRKKLGKQIGHKISIVMPINQVHDVEVKC